jgi:hypothetical protein
MPTIAEQIAIGNTAETLDAGVKLMNSLVTPCRVKPRSIWRLGLRPPQHDFRDFTSALNTSTYTVASRCETCGLVTITHGCY